MAARTALAAALWACCVLPVYCSRTRYPPGLNDTQLFSVQVVEELDLRSGSYDAVVFVTSTRLREGKMAPIVRVLEDERKLDAAWDRQVALLEMQEVPGGRLVHSPPGKLVRDYHDVRSIAEATAAGIKRALAAGSKTPLLVLPDHEWFPRCTVASVLAALKELYLPLQLRHDVPSSQGKVDYLGVWTPDRNQFEDVRLAEVLEIGRSVVYDIAASDPEYMTPISIQRYVKNLFANTGIGLQVVSDPDVLQRDYPLFAVVNRGSKAITRYQGRILYLTYEPRGPVRKTLFLAGKGVTYDTGGTDLKPSGSMVGMSRDKAGAAAVAGLMKVLSILKPKGIKVVGAMPLVRNSIGQESYVADEIITARSKVRIRVGNTDGEGRLILADVLCHMKEMALNAVNPHLVSVATLTGHARSTVGLGYTIAMDNGPAREETTAQNLAERGEQLGDMFEISTIRREDYLSHRGKGQGIDVMQQAVEVGRHSRGHQSPAAFLIMASGLDKHGLDDKKPLKYTHLDISPSAGDPPDDGTGCPLLGLYTIFIEQQLYETM